MLCQRAFPSCASTRASYEIIYRDRVQFFSLEQFQTSEGRFGSYLHDHLESASSPPHLWHSLKILAVWLLFVAGIRSVGVRWNRGIERHLLLTSICGLFGVTFLIRSTTYQMVHCGQAPYSILGTTLIVRIDSMESVATLPRSISLFRPFCKFVLVS